jgi:glycosyltransferase EpsE
MPKISVLMTTYDDGIELFESIGSILNQSFSDFEFLICDDSSSSGLTRSILRYFSLEDDRIILLENDENIGFCRSLNKCISHARGELLARMDADDISLPDRFQKEVDYLSENPQISFCGSSFYLFDKNGVWGKTTVPTKPTKNDIFSGGAFAHPSIMMRKKDLDLVGDYTEFQQKIRAAEDYDLWLKFYNLGFFGGNLNNCLLLYFDDSSSYKKRTFAFQKNKRMLEKKWGKIIGLKRSFVFWVCFKNRVISLLPRHLYAKFHRLRPARLLSSEEKEKINLLLNNQKNKSNVCFRTFQSAYYRDRNSLEK